MLRLCYSSLSVAQSKMRIQVEESTITKRLYLVFCGKTLHSLSKGPIFYSGSTAAAIAIVFDI